MKRIKGANRPVQTINNLTHEKSTTSGTGWYWHCNKGYWGGMISLDVFSHDQLHQERIRMGRNPDTFVQQQASLCADYQTPEGERLCTGCRIAAGKFPRNSRADMFCWDCCLRFDRLARNHRLSRGVTSQIGQIPAQEPQERGIDDT